MLKTNYGRMEETQLEMHLSRLGLLVVQVYLRDGAALSSEILVGLNFSQQSQQASVLLTNSVTRREKFTFWKPQRVSVSTRESMFGGEITGETFVLEIYFFRLF